MFWILMIRMLFTHLPITLLHPLGIELVNGGIPSVLHGTPIPMDINLIISREWPSGLDFLKVINIILQMVKNIQCLFFYMASVSQGLFMTMNISYYMVARCMHRL